MSNKAFKYLIQLSAVGDSAVAKLVSQSERFETTLGKVNAKVDALGAKTRAAGSSGVSAFGGMNMGVGNLIASLGIAATTISSLQATAKFEGFERSINFSSAGKGAAQIEFLDKTIDSLALSQKAAYEGFSKLSGGVIGTGITAAQTRDIFKGVAEGTTVMGLSAEESSGVFQALSQMASKGTVSAEELRGQLGERLPGAFGIAARSMGVTQAALGKMLEKGQIAAKDFLPKFAAEMHKTFGAAALQSTDSATANFNRFDNALLRLQLTFGEKIMPTVTQFLNEYLIPAVDWVGKNIDKVGWLALAFGGLATTVYTARTAIAAYQVATTIATALTTGLTGVTWGLNAALWANPITWVVGGLVALAGGIYYAMQQSAIFRAKMYGVWEVLKMVGSYLYDGFAGGWKIVGRAIEVVGRLLDTMIIKPIKATLWLLGELFNMIPAVSDAYSKGFTDNLPMATGGKEFAKNNLGFVQTASNDPFSKYYKKNPIDAAFEKLDKNPQNGAPNTNANDAAKKTASGITGGGSRQTIINVNKLGVDNFSVNTTNVREGIDQLADIVLKKLLQTLNMANQVQ